MRWTVAASCSLAWIHAAAAQPAQPAPPAQPAAGTVTAPDAHPAPRSDAAWQLYHDAFAALMQGDPVRARQLASALLREHPDHPATRLVRSAELGLAPGASITGVGTGTDANIDDRRDAPADTGATREAASRAARAELALFQSLHGTALGIEACLAVECNEAAAFVGLALAGGTLGAVASLNMSTLTSGQRALLNSGTAWGAVNAALALTAAEPDEATTVGLTLMAGQLAGLGIGAGLFAVHPTAGQVALANSAGQWAGAVSSLVLAASRNGGSAEAAALTALVSIDVGLAGGAYLASRWPRVSRAQTLVIDAGGIVGMVGGGGLGIVIGGDFDDRTTPALAAAGAVIGVGAAAYLTRDWTGGNASPVHAFLAPPAHGRGGIAGIGGTW